MNSHHCGMELEDGTNCDRPALHGGELHPQRSDIQHRLCAYAYTGACAGTDTRLRLFPSEEATYRCETHIL